MKYFIPVAGAVLLIVLSVLILGHVLDSRFAEIKKQTIQEYKDSQQVYVGHYSHGSVCVRGREYELIELVARAGDLLPIDTGFKCELRQNNIY